MLIHIQKVCEEVKMYPNATNNVVGRVILIDFAMDVGNL